MRPLRRSRAKLLVTAAAFGLAATFAAIGPARGEAGDELDIAVLTFGPGDHPFSKFGHDGILVVDHERGTSLVYNYGTFAFHSYWLIPEFLLGKYRYWLSVAPLPAVVASYRAENRSIVRQTLSLSAHAKSELAAFLAWNAEEENKHYEYDYYRDNCATRIRDVIDRASGGALRPTTMLSATQTWRAHTERLAADDFWVYLGLDFAMGPFIDQPISLWREMFLPQKLQETLATTTIEEGGAPRPLVATTSDLAPTTRPALRVKPPEWTLRFLATGTAFGMALVALGESARRKLPGSAALFGSALAALGLAVGVLGCLIGALWCFTNHEVTYRNENLFQASPAALLLVGAGMNIVRGRAGASRRLRAVTPVLLASSALGLVLKAIPAFAQVNGSFIALFLPLWAGAAIAAWRASGADSDP